MPEPVLDCWYLTGPIASGKTRVGLHLARRLGAEIISLDSMAIYRGMDIGTAKPTAAQRAETPHHLIDLIEPHEEYSLSAYVDAAHAKIAEIRSRGREVLLVGGTPLYLKSLLRGIFEGPPADWDFRRQVEEEVRQVGAAALHARLEQLDPLTAAKLHPNDQRRIIRALEVLRTTGQPISHLQMQFDEGRSAAECRVFVLDWPRAQLHRRIETRVEAMFAGGLIEEARQLSELPGGLGRTARQAVGYCEALAVLAGDLEESRAIEQVKARTRQFARRQLTWFRSLSECRMLAQEPEQDPAAMADAIFELGEPTAR